MNKPSLLDTIFQAFNLGGPNRIEFALNSPEAREFLVGTQSTVAGVSVTAQTAMKYPPYWRAVNLISSDVAKIPLHLYQAGDGNRTRAVEHPGYPLLRRNPNEYQTAGVFKKTLQFHKLHFGNGYAYISRDRNAKPLDMTILSPTDTVPVMTERGLFYTTNIGSEQLKFPARDVFHLKGLSFDGLIGYSVIDLMADALGLGIAAREYGARFYGQGSNASGILMIPGNVNKDVAKNIIKDWNEMATAMTRAHKVAVLQGGVTWQPTTIDPQKAQAIETRQFEVREVSNITGVPPHKLGDDTRTSHNSLENENQSYLDDCLDHHLCNWEEEAGDKLLTEQEKADDSHYFEFNRAALLKTDIKTRFEVYNIARGIGVYSANDIRRKENEEPIGEQGDVYLVPANMFNAQDVADGKYTPQEQPNPAVPQDAEKLKQKAKALRRLRVKNRRLKAMSDTLNESLNAANGRIAEIEARADFKETERQAAFKARDDLRNAMNELTLQKNVTEASLNRCQAALLNEREKIVANCQPAFEAMLRDRLERLFAVEAKQLREASQRNGNFISWYEGWYEQHGEKMRSSLNLALNVWHSLLELEPPGDKVANLVQEYTVEAQEQLLNSTNGSAAELTANIDRLVGDWFPVRMEKLVKSLLESK